MKYIEKVTIYVLEEIYIKISRFLYKFVAKKNTVAEVNVSIRKDSPFRPKAGVIRMNPDII